MSKYKAIVTTAGAAKIAAASAGGKQLGITHIAVGDGNGTLPTPNPAQTKLVNEKYRATLNTLTVDRSIDNHIIAELIIPANVGGFWLREMGLYDDAGVLIAVSNMAESYKPQLDEGSGRTQTLRMVLIVSSTEAIQLIAGGDTVLATRDFVEDAIKDHEKTRNHPDASTAAKGLVQLSSETTSTNETKAATPKAVKDVNDASVKKSDNLSDLDDKTAARKNLALGTAATKNVGIESGNVMQVGAFGLGSGSNHKANAYNNAGEIYRVNNTSENAPTTGVAGVVSLPCDGGPSTAYVAVSNAGAAWVGSSNVPANGVKWSRVYTTAYKPTAADVDAVAKTGDRMSGALGSTYSDTYRIVSGKYGTFWRNDGNAMYLMLTNENDQWGTYNGLRPLAVSLKDGSMTIGTQLAFDNPNFIKKTGISSYQSGGVNHNQTNGFILQGAGDQSAESHFLETVGVRTALRWRIRGGGLDAWPEFRNDGSLYLAGSWPVIQTSSGTTYHPDGNIEGSLWGGYLSNWLNKELVARDNNINTRATWDYVNSRSAISGGRNAWWYKDEVTGLIFQGGVVNRADHATWVGFPRGYARECFGVQMTLAWTNGSWYGDSRVNIQARDVANGGFNAYMDGQEQSAFWWAVGV